MNVFSSFIPNKLVTFNDKDPPWMSEYLNSKLSISMKVMSVDYITLLNVIAELSDLVCKSKDYITNSLIGN